MDNRSNKVKKRIEHWKIISLLLMVYDFLAIAISYFAALWIRFDCSFSRIDTRYLEAYFRTDRKSVV